MFPSDHAGQGLLSAPADPQGHWEISPILKLGLWPKSTMGGKPEHRQCSPCAVRAGAGPRIPTPALWPHSVLCPFCTCLHGLYTWNLGHFVSKGSWRKCAVCSPRHGSPGMAAFSVGGIGTGHRSRSPRGSRERVCAGGCLGPQPGTALCLRSDRMKPE